jgi:hypothetical protein
MQVPVPHFNANLLTEPGTKYGNVEQTIYIKIAVGLVSTLHHPYHCGHVTAGVFLRLACHHLFRGLIHRNGFADIRIRSYKKKKEASRLIDGSLQPAS